MNNTLRFPRTIRLVSKSDYQSLFDISTKVKQRFLLALYKPNNKPHARVGIIVSKRAVNKAVARNRIKRIVRESFRANQQKLIGLDIVIIAYQQSGTCTRQELRKGTEKLWERLLAQYQNSSS